MKLLVTGQYDCLKMGVGGKEWMAPEEQHPRLSSNLYMHMHSCAHSHTSVLPTQDAHVKGLRLAQW